MALLDNFEIRDVTGLTDQEKKSILYFLQGAIYCWCKNRKGEWFSLRDLMGGENFIWQETPLEILYKKHEDKESALKDTAREMGWLLKKTVHLDKRTFETKKEEFTRKYRWVGNEQ